MNQLEVKKSRSSLILAGLLGLILVPLGLGSLIMGLSNGFQMVQFGLGLMVLIAYIAVILIVVRAQGKSVRYFSAAGLTRNDGRSFSWADLSRVVNQFRITSTAHGTKSIWRTEIQFKSGESAWLLPTKISNWDEVNNFVNNLPCEHTEVRV